MDALLIKDIEPSNGRLAYVHSLWSELSFPPSNSAWEQIQLGLIGSVKGAANPQKVFFRDMSVDLGSLGVHVSEQFLDIPDIRAVFEKVGRKTMAERMDAHVFVYPRVLLGPLKDFLDGSGAEMPAMLSVEEPFPRLVKIDVGFEYPLGFCGENRVPVLAAFSALDDDNASRRIYVPELEAG